MLGGLGRQRRLCHVFGQWRKGTSATNSLQSGIVSAIFWIPSSLQCCCEHLYSIKMYRICSFWVYIHMRGLYHARGNWIQDGKLQALDLDDIRSMLLGRNQTGSCVEPFPAASVCQHSFRFRKKFLRSICHWHRTRNLALIADGFWTLVPLLREHWWFKQETWQFNGDPMVIEWPSYGVGLRCHQWLGNPRTKWRFIAGCSSK